VAGGSYYLGLKQGEKSPPLTQKITIPSQIQPPETPSPSPTIMNIPEVKEYKTRFYNTSDMFFDKEPYPAELISAPDSQLTPMYCSLTYTNYGKDFYAHDRVTQQSVRLTDPNLIDFMKFVTQNNKDATVLEFFTCTPKEGKTIVVYNLGPCGGGCSGIPHIGIVGKSGIQEAGTINVDTAYFGCSPLQLSNDSFYLHCSGGDGAAGSASIYKLSLNTLTITRMKRCDSGIDETGKQYSTCQ
jgi:hypothetical protein